MQDTPLPVGTRLWFAFVAWFRVLFDPEFAARTWQVREALKAAGPELSGAAEPAKLEPARPEAPRPEPAKAEAKVEPGKLEPGKLEPGKLERARPPRPAERDLSPALQLLALLQREGRLVDFLEEDVASFTDADIGAAARVVHEGCRKALREHVTLAPLRTEQEGARVTLPAGFDAAQIKLTGDVKGAGPYAGALRHRGWRASAVKLPELLEGADPTILTPAEVEL